MTQKKIEDFLDFLHSTKNVNEWQEQEKEIRGIIASGHSSTTWGDVSNYIEMLNSKQTLFLLDKYHTWVNS